MANHATPERPIASERRTTLEIGSFRLVRERRSFAAPCRCARHEPRRRTDPRLVAAGLVGVATTAILAVAAPTIGAATPYRLTVAVPAPAVTPSHQPEHEAPVRKPNAPTRVRPTAAMTSRPAVVSPADDLEAAAAIASRSDAITQALLSGDMQEWQDGPAHGYVVAGDIERSPTGDCRSLAILTRGTGAPDQVEQRHECLR